MAPECYNSDMSTALPARRSARLIILDPLGRLLLFRYQDEHKPPFWSTVGGELRPGETYIDAARRELFEETAFDFPIGPLLYEREDVFAVARSTPARWVEQYFLVRCDRADEPNPKNWTDEERSTIQNWKWWTLAEMREQPDSFLPGMLTELLANTWKNYADVACTK